MKAVKYWLQYLAVVSLFLLMTSGIYDIAAAIKASDWYLRWYEAHYAAMPFSSTVFIYALGLLRGIATLGCGLAGLAQVSKKRIRTGYLLFLTFWAVQYVLAVFAKAYRGIQPDDMIQMLIALFCFMMMVLQYAAPFKNGRIW